MGGERLIHISFREMREMFRETSADYNDIFFMTRGFAIGRGVNGILRGILDLPAPFFVEEGRLLLLKHGEAEATVNLISHTFHAGTLFYVGSGSIVQVRRASPDVQLLGMMFSDETLALAFGGSLPASFWGQERSFRMTLDEREVGVVEGMMQTVWDVAHQQEYSRQVVMAQLKALVCYCNWLRRRDNQSAAVAPRCATARYSTGSSRSSTTTAAQSGGCRSTPTRCAYRNAIWARWCVRQAA